MTVDRKHCKTEQEQKREGEDGQKATLMAGERDTMKIGKRHNFPKTLTKQESDGIIKTD